MALGVILNQTPREADRQQSKNRIAADVTAV